MDQTAKTFTYEGADARNWVGRVIVAVILGEAIWSLIVSIMNNLVVPWLGDAMGQSSGLPTSFTQRPYNYPDLFVSVVEFCLAGIVAAILNYFFQRPKAERAKPMKSLVSTAPVEPLRIVPQAATALKQATPPVAPVSAAAASVAAAPAAPPPSIAPAAVSKPVTVASSALPVADSVTKPLPSAAKAEPPRIEPAKPESAKPKKPKEVYYNIVGEPVSSDED